MCAGSILCSATTAVFCFQVVFGYLQWIVPDSLGLLGSVMTAFLLANKTLTGLCMTNNIFIDSISLSKGRFQITTVSPILTSFKNEFIKLSLITVYHTGMNY